MCSISGLLVLEGHTPDRSELACEIGRMMAGGTGRGQDAFGIAVVSLDGTLRTWHGFAPPTHDEISSVLGAHPSAVLSFNRATPTTEWRRAQGLADIQPFTADGWVAIHNGTIANDRELGARLRTSPPSRVDSAILPGLMAAQGFLPALDSVVGSFAVAAVELTRPGTVHLARNFKPLCAAGDSNLPVVRFASLPGQLTPETGDGRLSFGGPHVVRPDPYVWMTLRSDGDHRIGRLRESEAPPEPRPTAQRRVLAVTSGGLDSTVAATQAVEEGAEVTLLHFAYGCLAEPSELQAVKQIGKALGCPVRVESLARLGELGGSTLTVPGAELAVAEQGAEFPHEWVPARNMLMLAFACAIADAEGFDEIVLGTNLEEGGAYSDNTQEFVERMSQAAILGTIQRTKISAPLGGLVKHQIVTLGHTLRAPLEASWSCYRAGEAHCGRCGPCFMRRVAFEMAGLSDPTGYLEPLERVRPVT